MKYSAYIKGIFVILLVVFVGGCSSKMNSSICEDENNKELVYDINELADNIIAYEDGKIVYSSYNDNRLDFASIDKDNVITNYGSVDNPYIDSGDVAFIDSDIFFYSNVVNDIDGSDADVSIKNCLCRIGLKKNELSVIATDSTDQTLIYLDSYKNNIMSLKGRIENEIALTYIDKIDIHEKNGFETVIAKEYNSIKCAGEIIYGFSVDGDSIFLLVYEQDGEDERFYIEKEDLLKGNSERYSLPLQVESIINKEHISKFEVVNNVCFVRNFSGNGVLFSLLDNSTVLIEDEDLDIDISLPDEELSDSFVIYCRDSGNIWMCNSEECIIKNIELTYSNLRYVFIDREGKELLVNSERGVEYVGINAYLD